jgi:hypothetical protein
MNEYSIDPLSWFTDREMPFTPKHFTVTSHPLSVESKQWVLDTLTGRFSVVYRLESTSLTFIIPNGNIAFEDPKEAIFYELRWS